MRSSSTPAPQPQLTGQPPAEDDCVLARRLVRESPRWQALTWPSQRAAWIAMGVVLIAVGAGLLGDGPVAQEKVRSADGMLSMTYDEILRRSRTTRWEIQMHGDAHSLRIDPVALASFEIQLIVPQPVRQARNETGLVLWFEPLEQSGSVVTLTLAPIVFGEVEVRLGEDAGMLRAVIRILP